MELQNADSRVIGGIDSQQATLNQPYGLRKNDCEDFKQEETAEPFEANKQVPTFYGPTGPRQLPPARSTLTTSPILMAIKTVDMNRLAALTGNLYESVAVLSKRSRQISTNIKNELDDKLAYFEGFEQELEDPRFQEEQAKVSMEYEVKPEPTEMAIDEMIEGDVYFRKPTEEDAQFLF